jgi:hypothetical protein
MNPKMRIGPHENSSELKLSLEGYATLVRLPVPQLT